MTNEMLRAALEYVARWGPVVFPCEVGGKRPLGRLVPHGLKDATGDFEVIEKCGRPLSPWPTSAW